MKLIREIEVNIRKPQKKTSGQDDFIADRLPDAPSPAKDERHISSKSDMVKAVALLSLVNGIVIIGAVYTIDNLRNKSTN
jgi:hypothetical protein